MKRFVLTAFVESTAPFKVSSRLVDTTTADQATLALLSNAEATAKRMIVFVEDDSVLNSDGVFVEYDTNQPLAESTLYFYEMDEIGAIDESAMRQLGWRKCDFCGAWVSPQDRASGASTFVGGQRRCRACEAVWQATAPLEERIRRLTEPRKLAVGSYHSSNFKVMNAEGESFTMDDVKGIGLELECSSGRHLRPSEVKCTERFFALANPRSSKRLIHIESDATVETEFITNVMTERYFEETDWSFLTEELKLLGNDESLADVGFHIHVSKTWLGETHAEQIKNFNKVLRFVNAYQSDFQALSGRKESEMHWCSFMALESIKSRFERAMAIVSHGPDFRGWPEYAMGHGSNGCAIIPSGATIEFRIFHSTNDPVRIRNIGRFIMGLLKGICATSEGKCFALGKVLRFVPEDVMQWLHAQGLFLRSKAANGGDRGFSL